MNECWDFCILNLYSRSNGPTILKTVPEKIHFQKQKQLFVSCCFPETHSDNSIYSFSILKYLVFVYSFGYNGEVYSIAIASRHCFANIFLNFLQTTSDSFKKETPEERFNIISDLLSTWVYNQNSKEIKIFYPKKSFTQSIDYDQSYYMSFDPSQLIGHEPTLSEIWTAIIKGHCVLLVGTTPEQVSASVFSILSLFAPLRYTDHLLIYTGIGDPRFLEVINGSTKWKIVGTTNVLACERCTQFDVVVKLPTKKLSAKPEIRSAIQKKTNKLMKKCEFQMNKNLEIDPYFDLLELPLSEKQIKDIASTTDFTPEDIQQFLNSVTFVEWRKATVFRSQFRELFLSFIPECILPNRTEEQLQKMLFHLGYMPEKFVGDDHMLAVIHEHVKLIKKKLASMQ